MFAGIVAVEQSWWRQGMVLVASVKGQGDNLGAWERGNSYGGHGGGAKDGHGKNVVSTKEEKEKYLTQGGVVGLGGKGCPSGGGGEEGGHNNGDGARGGNGGGGARGGHGNGGGEEGGHNNGGGARGGGSGGGGGGAGSENGDSENGYH
ncbi:hypothetical protein V6Z12_A02G050400 [Gossypium hirsutum]